MVKLKEDKRAMPWPRRISRTELERFWLKLREDVLNCGEITPNTSEFYRKFSDLTYDSFEEALENFRGFMHACIEGLIREGFFKHPNKRTREHVVKALESKGLSTKGNERKIANSLARRVKKGVLKKSKLSNQWVYWTE